MANEVAAQSDLRRFPSAQRPGRGRQPRVDAKVMQQPLRVEREHVLFVQFLRLLERTVQQSHLLKIEWDGLRQRFRCDHGNSAPQRSCREAHAICKRAKGGYHFKIPKESRAIAARSWLWGFIFTVEVPQGVLAPCLAAAVPRWSSIPLGSSDRTTPPFPAL